MNGLGNADWPDRLVLKPGVRRNLWLEFKRNAKHELTTGQALMQDYLRARGDAVYTFWTRQEAIDCYRHHRD